MKTDSADTLPLAERHDDLAIRPEETLSVSTTARMMQAVIEKGITAESVGVMKELMALMKEANTLQAERDFAKAFNALQAEMPNIVASKTVPNNDGSARYKFAPYETIMEQVKPLLLKHGFTVTFSTGFDETRIIQKCTLQHTGGHQRTNEFAARIGRGPPGSSEAQGDGAASTYAKRFALCNALNITIESDTDAQLDVRLEGDVITPEQIQYLKETLKESGFNEATFWTLAGAKTFETIRQGSYPVLSRAMEMKKNAKKS